MEKSLARPADEIVAVVKTYGNILFRNTLVMLGSESDAEDAVQETLLTYMQKAPGFRDAEHKKAWLITVATNRCKDMLRFRSRHTMMELECLNEFTEEASDSGILEALMTLPEKFRLVLVLHYVEGYRVEDIAKMIGKSASAVKMRLQKGRNLLREIYRREYM